MESTLRRTWARINLDAIEHNYRTLKARVGENVAFLGVVKADAYGHGAVKTAALLEELGAGYLAVSSIDEAMELRLGGIRMPVLILGHTPGEQVSRLIEYDVTQAVSCDAKAREYSEQAQAYLAKTGSDKKLKIHIKVDTGMSRLGYLCDGDLYEGGVERMYEACTMPGLEAEGIFTHFAVSDEEGPEAEKYTRHQFELFMKVVEDVEKKLGHKFRYRHCANTGAVAKYPETYLDMVRPGLLLYGYGEYAKKLGLKPAMSLITTVSTIKTYEPGTDISYGRIYTTDKRTRMGVLPYGYADGFFRCLSNRYSLMTVDGPAPIRGKICMDMCMIDLTDLMDVGVGSEIEVFGENNPIEKMSEIAGTIPYEITCAVSKRVPRVFVRGGREVDRELSLRL